MKFLLKIAVLAAILAVVAQAQSSADPVKEAQRLTRVAQVAEQQSRYDDAIKAYQTITVIASGTPLVAAAASVAAGNIFMNQGRFTEAADASRKAVALDAA